jgi:hypothetical protein
MLRDLNDNVMTRIPHRREYDLWRANISEADFDAAVAAIQDWIADKDVFTSSFIPGNDWTGTPYEPLYQACGQSETQSGFFFGLIVWKVVMDDDDDEWRFKPAEKDNADPLGMTYWRETR